MHYTDKYKLRSDLITLQSILDSINLSVILQDNDELKADVRGKVDKAENEINRLRNFIDQL